MAAAPLSQKLAGASVTSCVKKAPNIVQISPKIEPFYISIFAPFLRVKNWEIKVKNLPKFR
jgi:hypothetical protein